MYQYLDGKAKTIVEQLQYFVEDPKESYWETCKILKEHFGNQAIIGTDFERKLATWPKIGPKDTVSLKDFSNFLQQVKFASKHIENLKALNYPSQIQAQKLTDYTSRTWTICTSLLRFHLLIHERKFQPVNTRNSPVLETFRRDCPPNSSSY